jgi:hypothetical protein
VTIDGQPGFRWWTDEKGVPHTAYHYLGGAFQENVGDAAGEFIEDLLGRGPIRDLIRLDDD